MPSSFTSPLLVEITQKEQHGRGVAKLIKQFDYAVGSLESPITVVTVPEGFETDFMSVPWYLRVFVTVFDRKAKASVLHDYLLVSGAPLKIANSVFREALMVLGSSKFEASVLWLAVHLYTHIKVFFGGKFT